MYQANYTSFDTVFDADGISGNTVTGRRSQYILENRRNENNQLWFNTVYKKMFGENLKVTAGFQQRYLKARHYSTLEDLLGGEFVVDIDKYAMSDIGGKGVADNDVRTPNRIVNEIGEVIGSDYYSTVNFCRIVGKKRRIRSRVLNFTYQVKALTAIIGEREICKTESLRITH